MGSTTTNLKMPYPVGTDPIRDGDNAMQSLAERIEARMPWGVVAQNKRTDVAPAITAGTAYCQLTGVTVVTGRRYRIDAYTEIRNTSGAAQLCTVSIRRNGVQVGGAIRSFPAGEYHWAYVTAFIDGDGATGTVDQYVLPSGGSFALENSANSPAFLVVTDAGPTVTT